MEKKFQHYSKAEMAGRYFLCREKYCRRTNVERWEKLFFPTRTLLDKELKKLLGEQEVEEDDE